MKSLKLFGLAVLVFLIAKSPAWAQDDCAWFEGFPVAGGFVMPIDRANIGPKGQRWEFHENGQSHGSLSNNGTPHNGEDWNWGRERKDYGEPLNAIADGIVERVWNTDATDSWGKCLLIKHYAPVGRPFVTGSGDRVNCVYAFYGHLGEILIRRDPDNPDLDIGAEDIVARVTEVRQGWEVAKLGNGNGYYGDEAHLHFEIRTSEGGLINGDEGPGYDWNLSARLVPNEFINNNELVGDGFFSVWVHPYEDTQGSWNGIARFFRTGTWDRRGHGVFPELGYGGFIWTKEANSPGVATWQPRIPRSGYYKVYIYVPHNYATAKVTYRLVHPESPASAQMVAVLSQEVDLESLSQEWVQLVDGSSFLNFAFYLSEGMSAYLEVDTNLGSIESVAADTVRFEYVGDSPARFSDVRQDQWFFPYVEKLFYDSVISGYADGTYRPEEPVTRAEYLKLVLEAAFPDNPFPAPDERPFFDVPESEWYAGYVQYAKVNGILSGCETGGFCPGDLVKRDQAAKILVRSFPKLRQRHESLLEAGLPVDDGFPDVDAGDWFYYFAFVCRDGRIIEGRNGRFEPAAPVIRAEVAKMIAVARDGWYFWWLKNNTGVLH